MAEKPLAEVWMETSRAMNAWVEATFGPLPKRPKRPWVEPTLTEIQPSVVLEAVRVWFTERLRYLRCTGVR